MAHVFISYERSDEATARKVIEALGSRHEVWSDALIPPHRDYTDEIQEHLEAAQVVLVLWSEAAANSQWVRAEADYAREHGKLVQIVLDTSVPPMPFNRIQCARLRGWPGDSRDTEWLKVLGSIEQLSTGAVAPTVPGTAAEETPHRSRFGRSAWLVGGLAAVALAVGALLLARGTFRNTPPQPRNARIAVLPFDTLSSSEEARYFADGLTDQIVTTLNTNHIQVVSRDDAVTLRGPDRDAKLDILGVALLFDGTVRNDGDKIGVKVHLEDPRQHAVLWSSELDGATKQSAQLQDRIAHTIVGVLGCSNRALRPDNGLSDPALLARYLRACDIFVNQKAANPQEAIEMLAALREVTVHAPDFAAAHSDLAKFDAYLAPLLPLDQAVSMRREAADEAKRSLDLEPRSPDAYLAQAMLLEPSQWAERERLLRLGVAADPEWPHTNGFLGKMLAEAGRLRDATLFLQTAAAADRQIDWTEENLWILGGAGQTDRCIEGLSRTLNLAPTNLQAWYRLFGCEEYAGRWDEAHAMIAATGTATRELKAWSAFVDAAKTQAPADLTKAKELAMATASAGAFGTINSIQTLSALGFVDDAFVIAERYTPSPAVIGGDSASLFLPLTASMRRDPRFMQLAARLGLVDYWRTSGHWPDFCSEPGLPYDCRAEADRATSAQPRLPSAG